MAIAMLGVVDVAMVSSLGQNDLAAVSYGARLMFFAFFFAVGWCGGLAILAPQFIGANKLKELRKTTVMAFYVLGSMLSLLITLFIFYSEWLAEIANTSPEFVSVTSQYISIASFSLIFTAIILPIEINLRALGKTRLTSVMSLVSVLLNMLFNYVLIFGKFGLPELGVMGAALGTVLARFLHTIILLIIITPNKEGVFPNLKQFLQFDKLKELKNYLSLTLPILLQNVGWSLGLVMPKGGKEWKLN
jgi:Na+-driven multidrug efflux pump